MHLPDSDHRIETIIDGEHVSGVVHYAGSSDISVRLEYPSAGLKDGVHMPHFARGVFPEGFLGDHGENTALNLLNGLYRQQKRGSARRSAFAKATARAQIEEFGRIRYLSPNPGHPQRNREILESGELNSSTWVQLEDNGPYRYARLFDTATGQPFLGEASVIDQTIAEYISGVKQDLAFRRYIKGTRGKLLAHLIAYAERLKRAEITPRQLELLNEFKEARRRGDLGLATDEIDALINLGYLRRDPQHALAERHNLEVAIERTLSTAVRFETTGKAADAERCRAKVRRLQKRIDEMTLIITERGKAVAKRDENQ